MSEMWIVIPRWEEHHHRDMARSKVPPWIKTYTKLLSDDDYLALSHHLRGVLLGLWLEYARARRQLRGSTVSLTRRLGQRVTTRDLEALNDAGFIHLSASKPARTPDSEDASLEVEGERETPTPYGEDSKTTPLEPRRNTTTKLPYLAGATPIWNTHNDQKQATAAVRLWLEGFTDNQQLIDAHLAALVARARVIPSHGSEAA